MKRSFLTCVPLAHRVVVGLSVEFNCQDFVVLSKIRVAAPLFCWQGCMMPGLVAPISGALGLCDMSGPFLLALLRESNWCCGL